MRWSRAFIIVSTYAYSTLFILSGLRVRFIHEFPPLYSFLTSAISILVLLYGVKNPKFNLFLAGYFGVLTMASFSGIAHWINYFGSTDLSLWMAAWDLVLGTCLLMEAY